ncbi:hypothetical protein M5689_024822 [Euphorbia peplus]|nr:hypothetical protein M5689_024822 [Euphorbia peplus]
MATEDFSFPTFTDALSSAVDSPPLWSLSPAVSPDSSHSTKTSSRNQQEEECKPDNFFPSGNDSKRRKSFSWIERSSSSSAARGHKKGCKEDQDNKMDMLWEDFNDDLIISSFKKRTSSDDSFINYMGSCVHLKSSSAAASTAANNNLRLSKNGKLQQHRMNNKSRSSGFVMFIKVLKKLIVFNKSHMNNIVPRNHCSVHPRHPHHVKLPW